MRRLVAVAISLLASFAGPALAQQPAPASRPEHVRGDVVALRGDTLEVKSRSGETVELKLAEGARVAVASRADLGSVTAGSFIGTTAVPQGSGALRAVEVHVFPESMRGVGEGHRPWDLQPGSTMTNATVSAVRPEGGRAPSTMTNATVEGVAKAGAGRRLRLRYPGGEKTVFVPPGTPVVKLEPGDRSHLVAGAHVFAIATRQPGGGLVAERLTVGEGGVVPPM